MPDLSIYADLDCELDSTPVSIRSAGRSIVVEVPNLPTLLKLFRLGSPRGTRRHRLNQLKELLDKLFITLDVKVAGRSVVRIGHHTGTARFWSFFGFPPLSFSANQALMAWATPIRRKQ